MSDRLDSLPPVQADALRGALGLGPGHGGDRFLVGAGVLSLLAEIAADSGVVCLLDDAQWADPASVDALVFAARRLEAEGVVLVIATRAGGEDAFDAAGLPELVLGGLDLEAAAALVAERAPTAAEEVRRRLVEGTGGNPLALVELPGVLTEAQLAGLESLPDPLPVGAGLQRVFADLAARLPEPTRRLLVLAAADDTGRLDVIARAAAARDLDLADLDPAEASGLIRIVSDRVEFRHPLVRSAVYQDAGFPGRQAAHRGLAAVLDGDEDVDRRAWHLAAGAVGPDEAVADLLESSAQRARTRAGPAAAAAALYRAATLTAVPDRRGRRLVAAAEATWIAGRPARAVQLLDEGELLIQAPEQRAALRGLRGLIELSGGSPEIAYPLLVAAALEAGDRPAAVAHLALAGEAASLAGGERAVQLGRLVRQVVPGDAGENQPVIDLLTGVAELSTGDWQDGAVRLRRVMSHARGAEDPLMLLRAGQAALLIGDEVAARRFYQRAEAIVRRTGAIGLLATTLNRLAFSYVQSGLLGDAEVTCQEGVRLAGELRQQSATADVVLALIAAWRGDEETCRRCVRGAETQAEARRLGAVWAGAAWALGLLELGLGRPDDAFARLAPVVAGRGLSHPGVALWATPDLVEAAARAGHHEEGRAALQRFGAWARRAGTPWGIALARRGAAQLAGGDPVAYEEALEQHEAATRPLDEARTRLSYGESLRRRRRRVDARLALRAAAEAFDRAGAAPWADRARAELRATGETLGPRQATEWDRLTPQELQIARLAVGGASNPEIATQLFLSRKTVEYHLHKVFTKLGVGGRGELARSTNLSGRYN
ncbi:LuxR family transcriptional regulator [Blastococcus sp. CT_GayMR19]|uniref:LuxR C-terminal-related transcriptional regulator n=1 Tax=Blastococcus sp. CT_GayMR19 TaxID=2559608 RepID=UPI0010735015|nr:LuxR family transcriptional regulator [Blastococcus sp. CT_GayMR19]TFV77525.1 LuxR family transcriptional regulator [Blastococcus sp. CT_GayMR19]